MYPCNPSSETSWRKLEELNKFVDVSSFENEPILKVDPKALEVLAKEAFHDISHFLRPGHLEQLRMILDDPDASLMTALLP